MLVHFSFLTLWWSLPTFFCPASANFNRNYHILLLLFLRQLLKSSQLRAVARLKGPVLKLNKSGQRKLAWVMIDARLVCLKHGNRIEWSNNKIKQILICILEFSSSHDKAMNCSLLLLRWNKQNKNKLDFTFQENVNHDKVKSMWATFLFCHKHFYFLISAHGFNWHVFTQ